jgi:hypothetical protein
VDDRFRMITDLEELSKRIDKIEKQKTDEVLTLVEILSNAAFFGEIKQASCGYAKDGQCSFFILTSEAKSKIPIVSDCRVKHCSETSIHSHLELSNITCALCESQFYQPTTFMMPGSKLKPKKSRKKIKLMRITKRRSK